MPSNFAVFTLLIDLPLILSRITNSTVKEVISKYLDCIIYPFSEKSSKNPHPHNLIIMAALSNYVIVLTP